MEVQVAESGACRRTLTIKVPAQQIKQHLDMMYRAAAQQVDLKGFRKGKVPRAYLEKKYGEAIQNEAKQELVKRTMHDACVQHELHVVGRAQVDGLPEGPLTNEDIEYTVTLDVRPTIELKDIKGLELKAEPTAVTDEDMEKALSDLAQQKRTLDTIDDAVGDGDFAKVDMTFRSEDGAEVSTREGQQINPNIPIAGTDPEAFKSQLVGAEKGQTIKVDLTFPETFDKEEVRGQKGSVDVVIHEVLRVQDPALDDEFAKGFEFDTIDALKEELQKRIGEQKEFNEKNRQGTQLLEIVSNDHPFELPESLIEDEVKHALAQFEQRMKENDIGEDEIKQKLEEVQDEARADGERRVRMFFLIDAIARQEEVGVGQNDVDLELEKIAAHHNAPLEDVRKHYGENNDAMNQLRLALLEAKVRDFLRENAKITDN